MTAELLFEIIMTFTVHASDNISILLPQSSVQALGHRSGDSDTFFSAHFCFKATGIFELTACFWLSTT